MLAVHELRAVVYHGTIFDSVGDDDGLVFTQYRHNAKGAIAALYHPEIGDVDLRWGSTSDDDRAHGAGLAKLIRWHPEVLNDLQGFISGLQVRQFHKKKGTIHLWDGKDARAAIRMEWNGQSRHWLLTAYVKPQKKKASAPKSSSAALDGCLFERNPATPNNAGIQILGFEAGASMATKKPTGRASGGSSPSGWLPKLRGSASDQKACAAEDAATRRAAGESSKSVILTAKDVQGEYDAYRGLMTTMGGQVRALTHDDLAAFRHNVRTMQSRYKGGIRARQVLDLSLPDDRARANEQIRTAVPVAAHGSRVRFMTNAGPDSDVSHHHVIVDYLSYASAASGARGDGKKSAAWMRKEPLRIECDCGRWRYWFRYIATIGKFNAGRDETGYPKVRNPNLHGVACKHILRVMAEVESSPSIQNFLARLIDKARAQDNNRVSVQMSQEEAEKLAGKPASRIRDVEATMRQRQRARERAALVRAAKKAAPSSPKKRAAASRRAERESAEVLGEKFGLDPKQVMKLLAQAQQNQKG